MPNSADFNRFAVNPTDINIRRSLFNMNHSVKFSGNCGDVIPYDVIDVMPGDTFTVDTSKVVRVQPLVAPIMDELILDTYHFFVPYRLVWNHFKNFMGENDSSPWAPATEYSVPKIRIPSGGYSTGSIADYMGVPVNTGQGKLINALPFRAYALIMDQWFRSEAIQDPVHVHTDDTTRNGVDGSDYVTDCELGGKPFVACKFPDYFTSCLPSPQRGDPVTIPLVDQDTGLIAPLRFATRDYVNSHSSAFPYADGRSVAPTNYLSSLPYFNINGTSSSGSTVWQDWNVSQASGGATSMRVLGISNNRAEGAIQNESSLNQGHLNAAGGNASVGPNYNYFTLANGFVRLSAAEFATVSINDLRMAFAIQKYLEKSARYGGRYIEFVKGFFGVDSPDARMQRAEYLGGSRLPLNINAVEQTSATRSGETPLGAVAGLSVTADTNSDFTKSFTEHGVIISLAVVRYHHNYNQGLEKFWLADDKFSFYNPLFANIGEQPVKSSQIYLQDSSVSESTFGYQEAWAELRYKPSRCAGEMRPTATNSLDMWHLGDDYNSRPSLSSSWIKEDKSNLDRCLAVTSANANQLIFDFYVKCEASRPLPLYSIPGFVDHN